MIYDMWCLPFTKKLYSNITIVYDDSSHDDNAIIFPFLATKAKTCYPYKKKQKYKIVVYIYIYIIYHYLSVDN